MQRFRIPQFPTAWPCAVQNDDMNRSADWLHQALKAVHLRHGQQVWGHGLGRSFRDLPPPIGLDLAEKVSDLVDRLRILDALYIPTRYPDSLPDGAPSDHFGRLQSDDALRHARTIIDTITAALA
jgi:HEPN domain-containing protein